MCISYLQDVQSKALMVVDFLSHRRFSLPSSRQSQMSLLYILFPPSPSFSASRALPAYPPVTVCLWPLFSPFVSSPLCTAVSHQLRDRLSKQTSHSGSSTCLHPPNRGGYTEGCEGVILLQSLVVFQQLDKIFFVYLCAGVCVRVPCLISTHTYCRCFPRCRHDNTDNLRVNHICQLKNT